MHLPNGGSLMSVHLAKTASTTWCRKQYLLSWREILGTVGLPNNEVNRRRVRRLHAQFPGPILFPKKGGQPAVCQNSLLTWWDGLEEQFHQSKQRQTDEEATLGQSYCYGREGIVFPDIAGHLRKRRD